MTTTITQLGNLPLGSLSVVSHASRSGLTCAGDTLGEHLQRLFLLLQRVFLLLQAVKGTDTLQEASHIRRMIVRHAAVAAAAAATITRKTALATEMTAKSITASTAPAAAIKHLQQHEPK